MQLSEGNSNNLMANEELFEELRSHLGVFLLKHQELLLENSALQKEIVSLKEQLLKKNQKFSNFQNQHKLGNIATSIVGKEGKSTDLKYKINEYIKEIDRCIIHLKK